MKFYYSFKCYLLTGSEYILYAGAGHACHALLQIQVLYALLHYKSMHKFTASLTLHLVHLWTGSSSSTPVLDAIKSIKMLG